MAAEKGEGAGRAIDSLMPSDMSIPTLETERFIMRPLVRDDAAALFPTFSDPDQCRYLWDAAFEDVGTLADWLCDPDWEGRSWTAVSRDSGALVARIVAIPTSELQSEIGYTVVKEIQRGGIASECTNRLVQYLFEDEDHHRITASTDPRNIASNRVLEKLGFRREAHFLKNAKTHLGWCDEYYWALLRSEWSSQAG
ncbi:GNAT family N-acetyltransferase [Altererythrobacter lutimaris]|uniref:GNAT family N-acetyltransferase n=1 Tax=Altererythrobacter lutimaris TaxID=2743979 RepID=A0A850H8S7_9SPHN|nr:GNAT family protein [Altererythrobacter lutimaris]NVE94189.1 GNAT family N-acetyltransferase [Altererythrobacter lutimaris]